MKNNVHISYSERKQLGRSQNIKHAKVLIFIVNVYLNGEFIEVPLNKKRNFHYGKTFFILFVYQLIMSIISDGLVIKTLALFSVRNSLSR